QFNGSTLTLNPNDIAYTYVGNTTTYAKVAQNIMGVPATNQAAIAALSGAIPGTYSFQLFFREKSTFIHEPVLQPVVQVYAVTGEPVPAGTGSVNPNLISLVHTSDFLLNGGSNDAGDLVEIAIESSPVTNTITALTAAPVLIDTAMDVPLDANGNPLNILSVRSTDSSTLYQYGVDYKIAAYGPYHQYALQVLTSSIAISQLQITGGNLLTVTANNEFAMGALITFSGITDPSWTFLNNQIVTVGTATPTQFTASYTSGNFGPSTVSGVATGSAIQNNQQIVITYNQFGLYERLNFVADEVQVLSGSLPSTLDNDGFVHNTWLPQSYTTGIPATPITQAGYSLILDGWDGLYNTTDGGLDVAGSLALDPSGLVGNSVPYTSRYIKVTYNNGVIDVVMKE